MNWKKKLKKLIPSGRSIMTACTTVLGVYLLSGWIGFMVLAMKCLSSEAIQSILIKYVFYSMAWGLIFAWTIDEWRKKK